MPLPRCCRRQCQAVCRRWRRVWFGEPALWRLVRLQPADEGQAEQLAVVRRVGPLVESLHATSTGLMQQTELKALLDSLPAGRRQRLREVWLSAEPSRVRGSLDEWELPGYNPLPAAAVQRLGRLRALRALELDSWQLPHRTASVLCTLSQLTRLRLRARQLPPGCLPGAIDERLTQLRSLVLETAMPCSPEGVAQLTALGALSLLVSRGGPCAWGCLRWSGRWQWR